jgi:Uma2 family endonuclease
MSHASKLTKMTVDEYMAFEMRATVRHEFVDGRLFAMSGATKRHNIIAGNIYSILRAHVRGSQCRAYVSDVKARVESMNIFYYPDVMVSCDLFDKDSTFAARPVLIVEVLSRSTAAIDRREKMLAYKQIESLKEYMIVHQNKQRVELHRRSANGSWDMFEFAKGDYLEIEAISVESIRVALTAIYEDVDWPQDDSWKVREDSEDWQESDLLDW